MNKFIIIALSFVIIVWLLFFRQTNPYPNFQIVQYKLQNKQLSLLLADTPVKWEKGLMNYRELNGVDGMLFRFTNARVRSFWNKNTLMNLDVYWINDGAEIGRGLLPSIEKSKEQVVITSPGPVDEVIEIPK